MIVTVTRMIMFLGIVQSFFGGVYGTAIGNTKSFGLDAQKLIGISG